MPEEIDALLLLNQNSGMECLVRALGAVRGPAVVVTSHALFQDEQTRLIKILGADVHFYRFDEFLADPEMVACDEQATVDLLLKCTPPARFIKLFEDRSERNKNERVAEQLSRRYRPKRIFFQHGLGIHAGVWQEHGGVELPLPRVVRIAMFAHRARQLAKAFQKHPLSLIEHDGRQLLFVGRTHRIAFVPDRHPRDIDEFHDLLLGPGTVRRVARALVERDPAAAPVTICAALHEYRPWLSGLGFPVEVFTDGYHPSNYPRTYLDSIGPCTYVIRDMFDARWLGAHGRTWRKPYAFLQSAHMQPAPTKEPAIRTIVVALNHAGNWTALVNRSDTDLLVEAIAQLARTLPHIQIVLRPHPTMTHPRHEGPQSLKRLRNFVRGAALQNFVLSDLPLEQDLKRGDFFVTEYSNVLITAWRMGKPGISVNLTQRRHLMKDYFDLGFPAVTSAKSLCSYMESAVSNPLEVQDQYRVAAARYNQHLTEFLR